MGRRRRRRELVRAPTPLAPPSPHAAAASGRLARVTVTDSPRLGITRWSAGTDPFTRAQLDGDHAALDDLTAIDVQGANEAARPTVGTRGRFYTAADTGQTWRDSGTVWREVVTLAGASRDRLAVGTFARANPDSGESRAFISTDAAGVGGLTIVGAVDQTAPLLDATGGAGASVRTYADGSLIAGDDAATALATVTVAPTATDDTALAIDHPASTPAGTVALRIAVDGTRALSIDADGRILLSTAAEPSTPAGGGYLYVTTGGALRYKSPGGTVTTLAPY